MDEDEICEIPAPEQLLTRDGNTNAIGKSLVSGNLKKLPFTLIIKKENTRAYCKDDEPSYAVKVCSKGYSSEKKTCGSRSLFDYIKSSEKLSPKKKEDDMAVFGSKLSNTTDPQCNVNLYDTEQGHSSEQKTCGSRSLFDYIRSSEQLSTKRKRGNMAVFGPKLTNNSNSHYDVNGRDFKPTQIIDIDKLRYCSFCFTSYDHCAQAIGHETCSLKDFSGLPSEYWPIGWLNVQTLSYKYVKCASVGCQADVSDSLELLEHIKACHKNSVQNQQEHFDSLELGDDEHGCSENESDSIYYDCNRIDSDEDTINGETENLYPDSNDVTESLNNERPLIAGSSSGFDRDDVNSSNYVKLNPNLPKGFALTDEKLKFVQSVVKSDTITSDATLKPYKCGFCHSMTHHVRNIMQHYLHCHRMKRLFICEKCKFVSHQLSSLKRHWSRYHFAKDALPEPIVVTEEPFDESIMIRPDSLAPSLVGMKSANIESTGSVPEHNLENYNEFLKKSMSAFRIRCKLCDYYTKTLLNMRMHVTTKHITVVSETLINMIEDTTSYRCVTCKSVQDSKRAMATHYVGEHLKVKKLECGVCEKSMSDLTQFEKHCTSDKHADLYRRSHRCKKCLYATLTRTKLQKHAITHAPDFSCTKCDFKTKSRSCLLTHVATHLYKKSEDGLYWCEGGGCGFSTKNKVEMMHHVRVHHNNKYQQISCDQCDFLAASRLGLFHHKRFKHAVKRNTDES